MATSNVKFYKVAFPSDTNCLVDYIEDYLSLQTAYNIDNFQYIKHDLNISIKISLPQINVNNFDYNYCRIINSDENKIFYYYIDKIEWTAQAVAKVNLKMDTVNSLAKNNSWCNPDNFTNKTYIERQHKDRYVHSSSYVKPTGINTTDLFNEVDHEAEVFDVPLLKNSEGQIAKAGVQNVDWYLVYDGGIEISQPIETYLCASEKLTLDTPSTGSDHTFDLDDFGGDSSVGDKIFYFFDDENSDGFTVEIAGATANTIQTCDYSGSITSYSSTDTVQQGWASVAGIKYRVKVDRAKNFRFYKNAGKICMDIDDREQHDVSYTGTPNFYWKPTKVKGTSITIKKSLGYHIGNYNGSHSFDWDYNKTNVLFTSLITGSHTVSVLNSINEIDRTKDSLSKIIKLPYCPIPYTVSSSKFTFDWDTWKLASETGLPNLLKYQKSYLPELLSENLISLNITPYLTTTIAEPHLNDTYAWYREPKLINSKYRVLKYGYDNVWWQFNFENYSIPTTVPIGTQLNLTVDYKVSSSLSSKFLFHFNPPVDGTYKQTEDKELYLISDRNNEDVIFNNAYLSYINNGYNYDKKLQAIQAKRETRQAASAMINSGVSAISSAASGNYLGAAKGISGVVTAAVNYTENQQVRQIQNEQKAANLMCQGANIAGCDDLQLLSYYNGNRLCQVIYTARDEEYQELALYFHLYGYNKNKHAVPTTYTRTWFNYIKCQPELLYEGTKEEKLVWLDDLKSKYTEGVTRFHRNVLGGESTWNWNRNFENWETWII